MSLLSRTFVAFSFVFALHSSAWAQGTGSVTGTVSDETGGVLPGVTVALLPSGSQASLEAITDGMGVFRFDNVPVGAAELTIRLINFSTVRRAVTVTAGGTATANATMNVATSADIVVTAPRTFRNLAEIENPAENLVGVASAGSEGAITAAQLEVRPVNRATEVLETVPGLVISQHSGEGKANQYYLRGFNLDHGFDFAQTVAGLPVNMPTHAHAQGYADSNFLIPELVSGVQYRKGPYYAENGDFSSAGSANINYFNVLDRPMLTVTGGSFNYGRILGAASPRVGAGNLLAAFEWERDNGPWVSPNNKDKFNGVMRYSQGNSRNGLSLTFLGFRTIGTPPTRSPSEPWTADRSTDLASSKKPMAARPTVTRASSIGSDRAGTTRRASPAMSSATACSFSTTSPTSSTILRTVTSSNSSKTDGPPGRS